MKVGNYERVWRPQTDWGRKAGRQGGGTTGGGGGVGGRGSPEKKKVT